MILRREGFSDQVKQTAKTILSHPRTLDLLGSVVRLRLPSMIRLHGLTDEFQKSFLGLTEQKMLPEFFVGHFSHLDPVVTSVLCQRLIDIGVQHGKGENLRGVAVTLAESVRGGQQSPILQRLYPHMERFARERGTEFVSVVRPVDQTRYGMKRNTHADLRPLLRAIRSGGVGTMLLAGGTVQPGRYPEGYDKDDVFGLDHITSPEHITDAVAIFMAMERAAKKVNTGHGQQPYFLPVSVEGTYRIFNSNRLRPNPEGLISLLGPLSFIGRPLNLERIYVDITVHGPKTAEKMREILGSDWRNSPHEVNELMLQDVAKGLRNPKAKGVFA